MYTIDTVRKQRMYTIAPLLSSLEAVGSSLEAVGGPAEWPGGELPVNGM